MPTNHGIVMLEEIFQFRDHLRIPTIPHRHHYIAQKAAPFGALDALTRSIMQDFLLELWEEDRKTVLLVTHDIDEAIYLADRTVVMTAHPGRVREIIDINLPRPRRYEMHSNPEFIELRDHVRDIVREEARKGLLD